MNAILLEILKLDPGNSFLKYIVNRVQRVDYRGIQISQHNRFKLDFAKSVLQEIYNVVQDAKFPVPPGDYSDPNRTRYAQQHYPEFVKIVQNIKEKQERTTINSLKKNFFPDFARAGFISRYGKDGKKLDARKRKIIYYARLEPPAIELVKTSDIGKQYRVFSHHVDILLGAYVSELANAIYNSDYQDDPIEFAEFQYIFSDQNLSSYEKINLLGAYRSLSRMQKMEVDKKLKKYCDPKRFSRRSKTEKRDYHNWRNETQQIMHLLRNTIYFHVVDEVFSLNKGVHGIFPRARKTAVRRQYFLRHGVSKTEGFETHHIVPLFYVRNKKEFDLIDNVLNLVYIKKEVHKKITREDILLAVKNPDVFFKNIHTRNTKVTARNKKQALYNEKIARRMENYNKKLLQDILNYEY